VGVVKSGDKALLIDCSDGCLVDTLSVAGITKVEQIVFTHFHRDQALGAYEMEAAGTNIGVPFSELQLFSNPGSYWRDDNNIWRISDNYRLHRFVPIHPIRVDAGFSEGDSFTFGPATIHVIDTPGHTEGSVSYLVEVDGRRVVFCGDSIYDDGQVWDIYSLQKGFSRGGRQIGGYHGFMGDRWRLVDSLDRILGLHPDVLVPSHGNVMSDPVRAVDSLSTQFETCYENYVAISALRHYFPELFTDYVGRPGQMPVRPGINPPDCLRHFGTTWMLVSKTGAAFVMDAGSPDIVTQLEKMLDDGEIKNVEGLWITHYHYDHTDGIRTFQDKFDCPCYADHRLADVLTNPTAWRLPWLDPEPIRVHRPMEDGQSWKWHEFRLTSYNFPGQTRYHDALLVEADEERMLFVGDSFTNSGIDDYCAYNRNWLGRDVGFQYCLSLIEKLKPTHIFNCHVDDAFAFTPEEIQFMRDNLDEREKLFVRIVPWDHANYGMDPSWVRCFPYMQRAKPGDTLNVNVIITNHSATPQNTACRAVLPPAFGNVTSKWIETEISAKEEKEFQVSIHLPAGLEAGRYVIPVDVNHGPWRLPQFTEAIIDVYA